MKVALISPFSMAGGGSTRLRDLVEALDVEWRIILPAEDKYGDSPEEDERLHHPIRKKSFLKLPIWWVDTLFFLGKYRPEVVHALKPHPYTVLPAILYKLFTGCRLVYDCDEWDPDTLSDNKAPWWQIKAALLLGSLAFRLSDAILYANHLVLEEKIPKKHHMKCFYVPNGVDLQLFSPIEEKHDGFNVYYVGVLHKHEHILSLIKAIKEAAESIPEIKCHIIGDGGGRLRLEEEVAEDGLEGRFVFHGRVDHERLPEALARADVLAAPFTEMPGVRYQCNMKIFEYMGLGKPIIASSVGDLPRILDDAGILVPAGDPKALSNAILKTHDNPREAERMAVKARKKAEAEYGWKSISKTLLKAYRGGRE